MKNKRKSIIGLGLIMALSVYAGAATTSTIKNIFKNSYIVNDVDKKISTSFFSININNIHWQNMIFKIL